MSRKAKLKSTEQSKTETNREPDRSLWDKVRERAKDAVSNEILPTLGAMGRQGASELGQALKAFPDSIGPQETTGTIGNPTQQQISAGFGLYDKDHAPSSPSQGSELALQPEVQQGPSVHGPEIEEPDLEP